MIILTTYNGADYYIDSDIILYAYDDTGCNIVLNQSAIRYNPNAEIFESNALQNLTVPTYANFVTATTPIGFIEVAHATLTTICVNCLRIKRLVDIDGSNTTIYFEVGATVDVVENITTLQGLINTALNFVPYTGATADLDMGTHSITTKRILTSQGTNVLSGQYVTLGSDGNFFKIRGNTNIDGIELAPFAQGNEVTLIFEDVLTVFYNVGGGGTLPILLDGGIDLTTAANLVLKLVTNGVYWYEVSRSFN